MGHAGRDLLHDLLGLTVCFHLGFAHGSDDKICSHLSVAKIEIRLDADTDEVFLAIDHRRDGTSP